MTVSRDVAEYAARRSYGRLVALIAARSGDIASAEDALSDAFERALATWPRDGIPTNPDAWLLSVARHRLIDAARHTKVRSAAAQSMAALEDGIAEYRDTPIPDERLKLLFVCAHPAIDPEVHTPLMLQAVVGLDAKRIASAYLVSPAAMSQRLVRVKAKIRDAGIAFAVPDRNEFGGRLLPVMEAIYGAFSLGWYDTAAGDGAAVELAEEAEWLARVLSEVIPDDEEALGLLALILHCNARKDARRNSAGCFIPLVEQQVDKWDERRISEAEQLLLRAAAFRRPGRFQTEAAIQSVYSARRFTDRVEWASAAWLYSVLERYSPTLGNKIAHAAAIGYARGAIAGLERLEAVWEPRCATFQPYWAVKAHFSAEAGRAGDAATAYRQAIALSTDPGVRAFLTERLARTFASPASG